MLLSVIRLFYFQIHHRIIYVNGSPIDFISSHSDLRITVDRNLKYNSHNSEKLAMANGITTNLLACTLSRNAEFLMNIYTLFMRPLIEYAFSLWNVG